MGGDRNGPAMAPRLTSFCRNSVTRDGLLITDCEVGSADLSGEPYLKRMENPFCRPCRVEALQGESGRGSDNLIRKGMLNGQTSFGRGSG